MKLLLFLAVSFAILSAAYALVGRALARVFGLASREDTPAHTMRDGLDYEPIRTLSLLPQHFSAIAAAGPIVGPIAAGMYFGWGPAWVWIILGSILVGGIHDFTALVASVRHKGRSIAEIVRLYMNPRAYLLFLLFIWFALIYVIIAFADVTAGTFAAKASVEGGVAPGPGVATSSALYLALSVAMGFALRKGGWDPTRAKLIFLPLVLLAIVVGPMIPLDLSGIAPGGNVQKLWGFLLLGYCFVAATTPVWALLQPRGELGGYFLYLVMIAAVGGVVIGAFTGGPDIELPLFLGWKSEAAAKSLGFAAPLFPILFITIACGACSGFHSVVASGTTSKQLHRESDARPVAYGGMLLEGFFACISLATVMILAKPAGGPDRIYAEGIREFAARIAAPVLGEGAAFESLRGVLFQFALLCFATFVFDTLDACTRLSRYVLMELLGWTTRGQALAATAISLVLPFIVMSLPPVVVDGAPQPLWRVFWSIFGSSNQLLAGLTLLGVSVWMARSRLPYWIALGPAAFMMVMTVWSLVLFIPPYLKLWSAPEPINPFRHLQFAIVCSLLALSGWLVVEAVVTWFTRIRHPGGPDAPRASVEADPAVALEGRP